MSTRHSPLCWHLWNWKNTAGVFLQVFGVGVRCLLVQSICRDTLWWISIFKKYMSLLTIMLLVSSLESRDAMFLAAGRWTPDTDFFKYSFRYWCFHGPDPDCHVCFLLKYSHGQKIRTTQQAIRDILIVVCSCSRFVKNVFHTRYIHNCKHWLDVCICSTWSLQVQKRQFLKLNMKLEHCIDSSWNIENHVKF